MKATFWVKPAVRAGSNGGAHAICRGAVVGGAAMRAWLVRYVPLLGHVLPTLVIGYCVVIPRSCIAGWNELTVGFAASVAGTCIAYVLGQRVAQRGRGGADAPS